MTTESKAVATRSESALFRPIDRKRAAYLIKTVWPDAPDTEVLKAAIICAQYDLNPLMKHVALIQFGKSWAVVLEIKATRIIAQKKHKYGYADGPRIMTEQEQKDTFGEVDQTNIVAVAVLEENGRHYPGYGRWPKNQNPYGSDKGNSKWNMAFIRAERNALDKLAPGELPSDTDVADDTYMAPVSIKQEIIDGKSAIIIDGKQDIKDLWPEEKPAESPTPAPASPVEHKDAGEEAKTGEWDSQKIGARISALKSWPFKDWAHTALPGVSVAKASDLGKLTEEQRQKVLTALESQEQLAADAALFNQ